MSADGIAVSFLVETGWSRMAIGTGNKRCQSRPQKGRKGQSAQFNRLAQGGPAHDGPKSIDMLKEFLYTTPVPAHVRAGPVNRCRICGREAAPAACGSDTRVSGGPCKRVSCFSPVSCETCLRGRGEAPSCPPVRHYDRSAPRGLERGQVASAKPAPRRCGTRGSEIAAHWRRVTGYKKLGSVARRPCPSDV